MSYLHNLEEKAAFTSASHCTQGAHGAFQAPIGYNILPNTWVATNTTFYTGDASKVDAVLNGARPSNVQKVWTAVLPAGK